MTVRLTINRQKDKYTGKRKKGDFKAKNLQSKRCDKKDKNLNRESAPKIHCLRPSGRRTSILASTKYLFTCKTHLVRNVVFLSLIYFTFELLH